MWWHCRWATGSKKSLWKDTKSLFNDYYGASEPTSDLIDYTNKTLDLLDRYGIKATIFVLGEIASLYPDLIKKISNCGHEIACHGWFHTDATELSREEFRKQVTRAKELLETLTGKQVSGYRAPNLVITPWLVDELAEIGFIYDSSVCPSRKFFGKYEGMSKASNNPFLIKLSGDTKSHLVEIPIPAMNIIRIPACSGIITRILGKRWTLIALSQALKTGTAMYYFHPYEIGDRPRIKNESIYIKLFLLNIGIPFYKMLEDILDKSKNIGTMLAYEVANGLLENR